MKDSVRRSEIIKANMTMMGKFCTFLHNLGPNDITLDEIPEFAQEDFSKFMIGKTVTPRKGITYYHGIDAKNWAYKVFNISGNK